MQPSLLNTGLFSPVFRYHLNAGPFVNWTTFDHLNTEVVRYSDGYCIQFEKKIMKKRIHFIHAIKTLNRNLKPQYRVPTISVQSFQF